MTTIVPFRSLDTTNKAKLVKTDENPNKQHQVHESEQSFYFKKALEQPKNIWDSIGKLINKLFGGRADKEKLIDIAKAIKSNLTQVTRNNDLKAYPTNDNIQSKTIYENNGGFDSNKFKIIYQQQTVDQQGQNIKHKILFQETNEPGRYDNYAQVIAEFDSVTDLEKYIKDQIESLLAKPSESERERLLD